MYKFSTYELIRELESFLFGGPETVEHVYEREASFQSVKAQRRNRHRSSSVAVADDNSTDGKTVYTIDVESIISKLSK